MGPPCHYPATHWVDLTPATHWVDCQNLWYGSRAHHPPLFGIHYRHGAPNPQGNFSFILFFFLVSFLFYFFEIVKLR